jgi:hypothetical protein
MAQVTITFNDKEDGGVDVRIEFDPPAKRDDELTPAQTGALTALQALKSRSEEWEEDFDEIDGAEY